jgi:hypothetical protein
VTAQDWCNLLLGVLAILAGGTGAAAHWRLNGHLGLPVFIAHRRRPVTGAPPPPPLA